jgi:phosphate transport system permease protein
MVLPLIRDVRRKEKIIEFGLAAAALITILTTAGIVWVLVSESWNFFSDVSIIDFFTDTQWTPLFSDAHYGILPLVAGTLLEILAAVPTVIYGYFALTVVTPWLQGFIPDLAGFNALSPGIVMGIMIIPMVSSLSEDALYAVPRSLRDASYGMGSTRFQTAFRVLVPAASSGIIVSVILAISRAIGETMIVAIAAGQQPRFTFDPTVPVETISTYIVQVSSGDVARGTPEYNSIFAAGITLFVFTLILNNISIRIKKRFAQKYE